MRHALLALATLALAACGPIPLNETRARQAAEARAPLLERLDRELTAAVSAVPRVDTSREPCLTQHTASEECSARRIELERLHREGRLRLRNSVLPRLARGSEVLGIDVEFTRGEGRNELARIPLTLCGRSCVEPEASRVAVGGRRVGWGLFQTRWQNPGEAPHGDARLHPGLTVQWSQQLGDALVTYRVALLTDGWRRPADWDER